MILVCPHDQVQSAQVDLLHPLLVSLASACCMKVGNMIRCLLCKYYDCTF